MFANSISAIFPAYNEEHNITRTVESARAILSQVAREWEIIVVNDGSKDDTQRICEELAKSVPGVRVIQHPHNRGYGAALKSGISAARHELIFFSDSDGQFDLEELPKFLEHTNRYDIVAGYRANRQDPVHRLVNAWGWNVLVRTLLGIRVRDIDCAFKVFRREVFEKIQVRAVGAMVNTEILAQATKFGMRIKELEVRHLPRCFGRSTGANLFVICKAFRELILLWGKMASASDDQEGLFLKSSRTVAELKPAVGV
jgi:glycosyltransferase involved in cell wall biosynthesis